MANALRKSAVHDGTSSSNGGHRLPPEAFRYEADVTPEGVDVMRKRGAKALSDDEWEVVDGFGVAVPA
ncbi:hypothetical protein [Neoaquamicrobium sediminum]|uniref:hypothetical protein n=1 Tax=Neoaquamicrobium sediminum TaxID=1849104 RepID=UPI0040368845